MLCLFKMISLRCMFRSLKKDEECFVQAPYKALFTLMKLLP